MDGQLPLVPDNGGALNPVEDGHCSAEPASPPLHIVHVITRLLQGGAEENTVSTCLYQARQGHRVTLVHGPDSHPTWDARLSSKLRLMEVPTLQQSLNPLTDALAMRDLGTLFRELQPDVVHTHQSKAGIVGRLAAAAAGVPLVVHTVHIAPFLNVSGARRWLFAAAERLCAKSTHLFVAVSHGMRQAFLDEGIGRADNFHVIHSGMPLEKFISARPPADWRSRIGGWEGAERPKLVLMLASFEPRKRQRQLIEAIAPDLRDRPGLGLLFAGEGAELQRCTTLARELGVEGQVRFLGHDPAPHELIALADLCLLTSEREGLPRSVVQYLAGGKPVVLSYLPGVEEVVTDGVNGVIADPNDLRDAVAKLVRLAEDDAARARLEAGARETDVSRWREAAMGESIERAYRAARNALPSTASAPRQGAIGAIEFFGLPGSGKTALARQVVSLLHSEGRSAALSRDVMGDRLGLARRSLRRLALIMRVLPLHIGRAYRATRCLPAAGSTRKDLLKSLWNYCSVLAMALNHARNGKGTLVLDQGVAQALWSARMHGVGSNPAPDSASLTAGGCFDRSLFVRVETPTEVAAARLQRRRFKTSRMQRPDRIGQQSLWDKANEITTDLTGRIEAELERRHLRGRLIRVKSDDSSDPAETARVIVAHLALLESGR